MRISTTQMTNSGVRQMLLRQAELQHTQLQLSTQKRILKASDDPVGATAINALTAEISKLEQYNANADSVKASNELEESVLAGATDVLFRMRELAVSLGNGSYDESEFDSIGVELKQRLDELVGLANSQDANGNYLFSGGQVKVKPFTVDSAGNYQFNGDQSQRMVRISSGVVVPASDSGFDVFVKIKDGNGKFAVSSNSANTGNATISPGSYQAPPDYLAEPYTVAFGLNASNQTTYTVTGDTSGTTIVPATVYNEGEAISFNGVTVSVDGEPQVGDELNIKPSSSVSLFDTVKTALDGIESFQDGGAGRAHFTNIITNFQESLDRAMDNTDLSRGKIGARLNTIDSEVDTNLSLIVSNKGSLSDIRDLDFVEASTRFSQQLTVLEAAQTSFVRVQSLSLFNFL